MNEIEKLIQIIKKDLDLLNQGIQKEDLHIFSNIKKDKHMLFLSEDFFIELVNKFCFHPIPIEYDAFKSYVPEDRLKLFESIFLSKLEIIDSTLTIHAGLSEYGYSVENLYIHLFLAIYVKTLTTSLQINTIFRNLLADWEFFIKTKKFPIQIITFLPGVFIEQDVIRFPNNFEIRSILGFKFIKGIRRGLKDKFQIFGRFGSFLFFKTDLSYDRKFSENIKDFIPEKFKGEWFERIKRQKELFLSLLLGGIHFTDISTEILNPWWFGTQTVNFEVPLDRLHEILPTSHNATIITDKKLKCINKLYKMINELKLFNDKEIELALNRYDILLKRDNFYDDIILDEFIILEFIFTRKIKIELSYRLSSNLALFLGKTIEEFKEICDSVNDFYSIRSLIVHGGRTLKRDLKKKCMKHLGINNSKITSDAIKKEVVSKLRGYIDKSLRKIIKMKYEKLLKKKDPNIMKDFEQRHYFIENSFLTPREKLNEE